MSEQNTRVVCVGEAAVELLRGGDGRFGLACGGDTFNVAVYLARAGIDVGFATALGDDPYSDAILALAAAEGVASELVLRLRGRLPGTLLGRWRRGPARAAATSGAARRRRANYSNCRIGDGWPKA